MQSTPWDLAGMVPAMESEAGLTTTTPLSHSDERSGQYKFGQSNLAVGDKRPAATYREHPSSPTQSRCKRPRAREGGRSVGVTSPSSSFHNATRGPDHNGYYEVAENGQFCVPKAQSQKPLSNHSINGNDESIDNSTLCSTITPQSSTASREEKSRDSSVKMQSTVQSRHFGKPSSGKTHDPQPFSDHHNTGVPAVNSNAPRTPQRRTVSGAGRNSSGSNSSCHRSPASGSSSKGSGKSPSSDAGPKPLGMICWHKVNGVGCPGYRSAEPRRLLSDHSMTQKYNFNHILSSPCQRCKRIFDSEEALDAHSSENVSCTPWPKGQRQPANEEICQTGATPGRMDQIKNALVNFNKCKILPSECTGREKELENWVASNVNEYVGESQTTSDDAKLELGKWFIGWYMFFPRSLIPNSPFVATERKKSRGWQLLEPDLLASGLEPAKLLELRLRYEAVTDIVDLEDARREHEARRMKGQNPSTSTSQSSTPVSNSTVSQPNSSPPSQSASVASSNNSRSSNTSVGFVPEDPFSDRAQAPSLHEASNSPTGEISRSPISTAPQPTSASPTRAGSTASNPQNWSFTTPTPETQALYNEFDIYLNFNGICD